MAIEIIDDGKSIRYDAYVKQGSMQVLREALGVDNPDQLYNYLKNNGIAEPEIYGIFHPIKHSVELEHGHKTKEELLSVIADLKHKMSKINYEY